MPIEEDAYNYSDDEIALLNQLFRQLRVIIATNTVLNRFRQLTIHILI
jgi:hypothetical protein